MNHVRQRIVGVRYKGLRASQPDTLCKSGAVWAPEQVLNFSSALADRLVSRHPDVWEKVPVDYDASTYLSEPSESREAEPVAVVRITDMSAAALCNFARYEFGHALNETDGVSELRSKVLSLMRLELAGETTERTQERFVITHPVTSEEYAALMHGVVELRLVPVRDEQDETSLQPPPPPPPTLSETAPPQTQPAEAGASLSGNASANDASNGFGAGDAPTLDELLPTLDREGLKTLATQEGIAFARNIKDDALRELIRSELMKRSGT